MDFDIKIDEDDKLRQAFRTRVPGLDIRINTSKGPLDFAVRDISAAGFAFADNPRGYSAGLEFTFDLLLSKKLFLGDLKAKVSRVLDNGIIGCNFLAMDRRQEIRLDKLVLEVQKRLIELRKAKREAE
ncbi:MAG: PilZ domain-containing protein [Humidesulfovibrio sp.]|nr:PilZ domain-containing protein [Desulfovibrio sp.]MDO9082215.1 PilZ domain-containing protein [Humidesulfovibrio sp.]